MLTVTVLIALSTAAFGFPAAQHEQLMIQHTPMHDVVYIPDFMLEAMGMAGHPARVVSPGMVTNDGYSQVHQQHHEEPQKICLQQIVTEQPQQIVLEPPHQIMIPEQHQHHHRQYEEHPYHQEPQHIILNPEHSLYISTQDEYGNLRTFKLSQNSPLLRQSMLTGQEIPVRQQTVDETSTPTQEKVVEEVVEITEIVTPQEIVGAPEIVVPEVAVETTESFTPQEIVGAPEIVVPEVAVETTEKGVPQGITEIATTEAVIPEDILEIFTPVEPQEGKESAILEEIVVITGFIVPEENPIETQETQLETPEVKNDVEKIEILDVTKDNIEHKIEIQEPKDEVKVEKVKVVKPKSKKRKQKVVIVEPTEEKVEEKLFTHAFHDIEKRDVSAETLEDIEEGSIERSDEYSSKEPEVFKKDLSDTLADKVQSRIEFDSLETTTAQRIADAIKLNEKVESDIPKEGEAVEPAVPELESAEEEAEVSQEEAPIEIEKSAEEPDVVLESTESEEPEHLEDIAQPKKAAEEAEDSNENVEKGSSEEAILEETLSPFSDVTPAPTAEGVLPVPEHILATTVAQLLDDDIYESTEE